MILDTDTTFISDVLICKLTRGDWGKQSTPTLICLVSQLAYRNFVEMECTFVQSYTCCINSAMIQCRYQFEARRLHSSSFLLKDENWYRVIFVCIWTRARLAACRQTLSAWPTHDRQGRSNSLLCNHYYLIWLCEIEHQNKIPSIGTALATFICFLNAAASFHYVMCTLQDR